MKFRSFVDHVYQCHTCESSTPSSAKSKAYLSSICAPKVEVKAYPNLKGPNPIPRSDTNVVLTPASFIAAICLGLGAPMPAGGPLILTIPVLCEEAVDLYRGDGIRGR